MPESKLSSEQPDLSDAPRRYAWPKYVLAAVVLFFTVCIIWTFKEVARLRRAKADGMEMRSGAAADAVSPTNPAPAR